MHPRLRLRPLGSSWRVLSAVALASLALCAGCKACREDDAAEEEEERSLDRDHYWRAQVAIVGAGDVHANQPGIHCASNGRDPSGPCGPVLFRFKELKPAILEATPAPGWRLDHWESRTRGADGTTVARRGPMPDGARYVNGFGYSDTGALETVTAVFVPLVGP